MIRDAVRWVDPRPRTMLDILHSPIYTGAYVYGRRESRTTLVDGARRTSIVALPRDQWRVFLPDRHLAYLSWEEYLENQDKLAANRTTSATPASHRAALDGAALLQGLVLCGKCGGRMHVYYAGEKRRVYYRCNAPIRSGASTNACWTVAGAVIDARLTVAFLEAAQPPELELALAVSQEAERQAGTIDEQWRLRIERARYEARHAERRYMAVDPDNRVVARTLEAQWEEKLRELEEAEREHERARQRKKVVLTDEDRKRILGLARDLPRVWEAATTTNQQRKNLLRILVREVTLTPIDVPRRGTRVQVLWESGAVTEHRLGRARYVSGTHADMETEERIRALVQKGNYDEKIAEQLNDEERVTGKQRRWDQAAVARVRRRLKVLRPGATPPNKPVPDQRADGLYSTRAVAERFGVPTRTVNRWAKVGILEPADGGGHGRPSWFNLDDETIERLEAHVAKVAKFRRGGAS